MRRNWKRTWKTLLALALCAVLVTPAEAQRGGRNRGQGGQGGRGGGRGGGRTKARNQGAAEAKKAEKAAQERAAQLAKKKKAEITAWAEAGRKRAAPREANLKRKEQSVGDMGPIFRSRCGTCHANPDPTVPADATWISSIATTRCRELPPDIRERMIDYLKTADSFRPHPVTRYAEPAPGQASISSGVAGELFLTSDAGTDYRLAWTEGQETEKRVLAPGRYKLTGYRATRGEWTVSMSGGQRTITVAPDKNVPIKFGLGLEAILTANPTVGTGSLNSAAISLVLHDAQGQSVSLYQGGRRVRIPFQVVDANGTASNHGVLAYASEGRAEAPVSVPLGGKSWARVSLPFDLPFKVGGIQKVELPSPR